MTTDLSNLPTCTIPGAFVESLLERLGHTQNSAGFSLSEGRRPVHVVYGGAHLFNAGAPEKIGARARTAMETWGADDVAFGNILGLADRSHASDVATRVREKLIKHPVEAMCIDFEDGYGPRSDDEEDAEAIRAATELTKCTTSTSAPTTLIGIRIKALEGRTARRAVRTLDLFVTTLLVARGELRPGFSVTLPKVTHPDQVAALVELLERLESSLEIGTTPPRRRIGIELMIESPRALVDADTGAFAIPALVAAGRDRVVAVHLGAYDLTAELGVTAGDQRLDHPYCDFARMLLQLSLAGSHVGVADGATTLLPIVTKGAPDAVNTASIHRAWALHANNVKRAIEFGIWQGWDLHPAQLPARYGALFAYFIERKITLAERLRSFVERATQASRVGAVFDDAATGQGLVTFFLRGLACGALDPSDLDTTTLTIAELQSRSFADIVAARAAKP